MISVELKKAKETPGTFQYKGDRSEPVNTLYIEKSIAQAEGLGETVVVTVIPK